jgi:hypothetical protein
MRAVLVFLVCAACGQVAPSQTDASVDANVEAAPSIPTAVCDQLLDAYTGFATRCGDVSIAAAGQINVPDTIVANIFAARVEVDDHYCNNLPRAPGTANLATELAACTNALIQATSTCDQTGIAFSCGLQGTLPTKATCTFNEQCVSGFCDFLKRPLSTSTIVCGACAPLGAVGAACGNSDNPVCEAGSMCLLDVCTPLAKEGESCAIAPCQGGGNLACDPQMHTCVAAPGIGQPCSSLCAWGGTCVNGVCDPFSKPLPTCGLYCSGGGVVTDADTFTPCSCGTDEYCVQGESGWCAVAKHVGDACFSGSHCGTTTMGWATWLVCNGGVCAEPDVSQCP